MPHSTTRSGDVLEFLCDIRFHRQYTYVSNGARLRVSYSDYGDPSSKAVVLFFGGLMGGRMSYSPLDAIARKHKIRIVHPDRPGMGGTTPVAVEDRIPTYLAMIPQLLAHLNISHISLAAHSFGTIYALNALLLYPHFLHPSQPYVAFFAPWVHPDHTGVRHLQAAELLPGGLISKFSSVARFVNSSIGMVGVSSGLSATISTRFLESSAAKVSPPGPVIGQQHSDEACSLDLNNTEVVERLRDLIPTFLFAENIDGAGQDAQLCLRRPRSIPWSTPTLPWEDIDDAVRMLRNSIGEEALASRERRRWIVDSFHAETDVMVGKKGRTWFDQCWLGEQAEQGGSTAAATEQGEITYKSQVVGGSDHDFILDTAFGASEKWLERVAIAFGESAET